MIDLVLAILHHILAFGLAAMLASETVLVRPGMSGRDAMRAAKLDGGYGATAGLIFVIGLLRVMYGLKGPDYYLTNIWFWGKLISFGAIGILSIPPTMRFLKWRKAAKSDPGFVPASGEVAFVRAYVRLELAFLILVLIFAATMARYTAV
jgi:putative membrane protein